jgi:hypothetical protein
MSNTSIIEKKLYCLVVYDILDMKINCLDLSQYLSQFKNPEFELIPSITLIYHVERLHNNRKKKLYCLVIYDILDMKINVIGLFVSISNENQCDWIVVSI